MKGLFLFANLCAQKNRRKQIFGKSTALDKELIELRK